MDMPKGWERLKGDDENHPNAAELMKEMAEVLEWIQEAEENPRVWELTGMYHKTAHPTIIKKCSTVLNKWEEWK